MKERVSCLRTEILLQNKKKKYAISFLPAAEKYG